MSNEATFPEVVHDFHKTNGTDTSTVIEGPSLTRQEFMEECDINVLMSKYEGHVIGGPGNLSPAQPFYADFTQMPESLLDYMTFMDQADTAFMSLPAQVRKEFDNSAHAFVEYASDPGNLEQMREWGLAPPAKVESQRPPEPNGSSNSNPPTPSAPNGNGAPAPS